MGALERQKRGGDEVLPASVIAVCREAGLSDVARWETLKGGMISVTRRVVTSTGLSLVVKESRDALPGLYECEADGLRRLSRAGRPRTPRVLAVTSELLLLEDLGAIPPGEGYWEAFGRAVALQHTQNTSSRFGYDRDNYLGQLPQHNGWMGDGHAFFAERRLLRYLPEPLVEQTLSVEDRRGLEVVARRLPELIPQQTASLLHGDLWWANMLVGPEGEPAVVDPAVSFGWPEAELSMTWGCGRVPESFYAAYFEVNPLLPGWEERFRILHLREILSMIAHFGNRYSSLDRFREVVGAFC